MFKSKTPLTLFSLVLATALLLPHAAALGRPFPEEPTPAASEAGAPTPSKRAEDKTDEGAAQTKVEAADEGEEARPKKRKGNAFARALGAPFRALARLFGGGKSKSETAKKSPAPAQPPATDTAAVRTAQNIETVREVAVEESKPGKGDAAPDTPGRDAAASARPAPAEAPRVEPLTAAKPAREAEGVRVVRPSEGEVARELQPRMWIPKIVGVPSDPISQGRALLQHGYVQEAIAELQTATTTGLPEQLAEANSLLGLAYDRLGWHRQAAEAYERALDVSPKNYVALANLGYSLYLADDYRGALKRLKQAARLAPNEPVISNNLGVVNARLGRYGDAFKNFARGSNEYEAHLKLAGILEDQRRDKDAVKHYEAALHLQPGASAVLERLIPLYERTGARDKADTARRALGQPRNQQKTTTGGGG